MFLFLHLINFIIVRMFSQKSVVTIPCLSLLACMAFFFTSCLNNDTASLSGDAAIYKFYLVENDSIEGLSDYLFTIDQVNNRIFNQDSLPYRSDVSKLVPNISFYATPKGWLFNDSLTWNGADSLDFSSPLTLTIFSSDGLSSKKYTITVNVHQVDPDSMVWSKTIPSYSPAMSISGAGAYTQNARTISWNGSLWMYNYSSSTIPQLYISSDKGNTWTQNALSGLTRGTQFEGLSVAGSKLFVYNTTDKRLNVSEDGANWTSVNMTALRDSFCYLVGAVDDKVCGIVKDSADYLRFFTTKDFITIEYSKSVVPLGFPVRGQATANYETSTGVPVLTTGLGYGLSYPSNNNQFIFDSTFTDNVYTVMFWSTQDGLNWANLTSNKATEILTVTDWNALVAKEMPYGHRTGASLYLCDKILYLTGGIKSRSAICDGTIWYSRDGGCNWKEVETKKAFPSNYDPRMNASVIVDDTNIISIYGGSKDYVTPMTDIWHGRINKYGFSQ